MAEEIVIRRATANDLRALREIYNHAILHTTATFDCTPKTLRERREWLGGHDSRHVLLVAEIDRHVAGWGDLRPLGDREAYRFSVENGIYVDEHYRGRGVGSRLLDALLEHAANAGFHTVIAKIVAGNDISVRIHERAGFGTIGRMRQVGWKFDQWLDVIIMQKFVSGGRA
jgi:L-amino acid N-acyltransferase YncA